MSRWIEVDHENGIVKEEIKSLEECRYLYNEVCCNELSDCVADYPDGEYCQRRCPHFAREDGIIDDATPEE